MTTYNYLALDACGKRIKGTLNGDSDRHVRRLLKEERLVPLQVSVVKPSALHERRLFQRRIKSTDLAMILRQLATLQRSGLTVDDSLKLMAGQSETPLQRQLLLSWRGGLTEGQSLSQAIQQGALQLPGQVVASIAVGEQTGHLEKVLERLAAEQERLLDNRQTLKGALVYPLLLIIVAVGVLVFVMTQVVPKVTVIFASQQVALPTVTIAVMAVSAFLSQYGLALLALLLLGSGCVRLWLAREANRFALHSQLLRLPRVGYWIRLAELSDWCRGLALLLGSGVPAVSALQIATTSVGNLALKKKLVEATELVRQGASIHQALSRQQGMPGFMLHLVGSGEASSELETMLIRVADYYAGVLRTGVDTLLKLLNPILLIFISLVVMVIILGVLTPIMQMNQMI